MLTQHLNMVLNQELIETINKVENKALATMGADGPNLVPLSMVVIDEDKIVVCDCFMDKTSKNLTQDSRVALAFWTGFVGVQIKGVADYQTAGEVFNRFVTWLKEKHPDRTLRGVLVIEVAEAFDLAPQNAGVKIA